MHHPDRPRSGLSLSFDREQEGLDWAANPGELDLSAPEPIVEEQRDGSMLAAVVYNHYGYAPETAAELAGAFQRYARIAVEHPDRPLPGPDAG